MKNLKNAYIFGSYASGKLSEESDIDLLLIGGHDFLEVQKKSINCKKFLIEK